MRRWLLGCLLALCLPAGSLAATPPSLVLFDEAATPTTSGVHLQIGYSGLRFGRMSAVETAATAQLDGQGNLPVATDDPLFGLGCLRVQLRSTACGWWQADLPLPSLAPLGDPQRLALVLAVRGAEAGGSVEVGLTDGATPRHAVRIPLARYGPVADAWTVYHIPLADFTGLLPALDLAHLASLQLYSSRPTLGRVDFDRVLIQPAGTDRVPAWVVTPTVVHPKPPTATRPLPLSPARLSQVPTSLPEPDLQSPVVDPSPARTTDSSAEPDLPAPAPPSPGASTANPGATPPVVIRVMGGGPAPTGPGPATNPGAAQPAGPVTPPTPAPPTVAPGPKPLSPVTPKPEPGDQRPMSVVSVYFSGGATGPYADSLLRATWATNHGERDYDAAELKDGFDATDDGHLNIVADPAHAAGALRLCAKQVGFAWWLARLNLSDERTSDESNWLRNGRLELAVRGEAGGEVVRVGLVDGQTQPEMALVPLSRFAGLTTEWQTVRVPLRVLKQENAKLDWTKVRAAVLASANGRPLTVYVADVRIVNPAN